MKKNHILPILFLLFHVSFSWASFEKIEGLDKTRITQITFSKTDASTALVTSDNTLDRIQFTEMVLHAGRLLP
jgi:hypothetical protein